MDDNPFPTWFPFLAFGWILFVIGASVAFRGSKGKPVIPAVPANAIFVDRSASGRWASNCLMVTISKEALSVVPKFPFNLMFLPEIYGLERMIPIRELREVRRLRGFGFGNNVAVDCGASEFELKVRDPQAFVDTLAKLSVRVSH